jgi:hypothetical protein
MNDIGNKFTSSWWDNFLKVTKKMTKTSVFKDCNSKEETTIMQKYILEILVELAKLRTNKFGYRVYIDGVLLENNEMIQIYDSPPQKKDTIETWSKRTFGDKKFGMIINQGERFNLKLSKLIALKMKPLLEKNGMPTEGIIFTLFIGNYDKTPLGIHLDLPGKSVMHFHLGPGSKTMYTWDTKTYESLVGEKKYNNQDLEKYLPYASKYEFFEGDLYFMPEDTYHVGTQKDLSIAIACWYNNRSKIDFAKQLQSFMLEKYLKNGSGNLKADKNELDNISIVNESLDLFEFPEELEKLSFKDLMREEYTDLRYSLFSNGGFRTSPFPKKREIAFDLEENIQIETPFEIKYKESINKEKLHVFIRGIKVEINNFDCIKKLIDTLNNGNINKVKDLLNILESDWDDEIGFYLLNLFFKHHGIKKIK